jgi:Sulfotransferase family
MAGRPILVTGSTRSGTTWVGAMLCASGEAGYINEPFNPMYRPGWVSGTTPEWHTYITEANASPYAATMDDVVRFRYPIATNVAHLRDPRLVARFARDLARSVRFRRRGARPLLKEPFAVFSAPWFGRRYGADVVMMIRHPAGVISSVRRLGWGRNLSRWAEQPELLDDLLCPYADQIRALAKDPDRTDAIGRGALAWNCVYSVVRRYREEHPGWRFVRYEDVAAAPEATFADLYASLGMRWDDRVAATIRSYSDGRKAGGTDASDPHRIKLDSRSASASWRARLTDDEIERIRRLTSDVWPAFYSPSDWHPEPAPEPAARD